MRTTLARIVLLAVGLAATSMAVAAQSRRLELATPEGAIQAFRRVQCSADAYGRVDGEPDRLLFRFEGMNIRQCVTIDDPVRGKGFRQVSREVLYYQDPATGEILDEGQNPWTGDTVKVLHIANDLYQPVPAPHQIVVALDQIVVLVPERLPAPAIVG